MFTMFLYGIGGLLGLCVLFVLMAALAPSPGEMRANKMTQHLPSPDPRVTASILVRLYHHVHDSDFRAAQEVIQSQNHWVYQHQQRLPGVFLQNWFRLRAFVTRAAGLQPRPQAFTQERCAELRVQSLQLTKGLLYQLGAADLADSLPDWNEAETAGTGKTSVVVTKVSAEREFRQIRPGTRGDVQRVRSRRD